MGKGLKKSKVAVASINYEVYEDSGPSVLGPHDDYYVIGIGQQELAEAEHDPVYAEEVNKDVIVFLQDRNSQYNDEGIWNKTLKEGTFSDPITSISSSEVDDFYLKAKGSQYLVKGNLETNYGNLDQRNVYVSNEKSIFKGSE